MDVESLDLSDAVVAAQVISVQRAAYAIEADLIGSNQIPPLHESIDELMAASLHWRGIRIESEVVAALGFTQVNHKIDIDRLVVAPDRMRSGYGSELLRSLDPSALITVSTGTLNLPAHEFYRNHGFAECGRSEPVTGLSVTHFRRVPA